MTSVLLAATELAELERGDGTWENIQALEEALAKRQSEDERRRQTLEEALTKRQSEDERRLQALEEDLATKHREDERQRHKLEEALATKDRENDRWRQTLEEALATRQREDERRRQHLDALARTVKSLSDELRRENEVSVARQLAFDQRWVEVGERLVAIERRVDANADNHDALVLPMAKAHHRLELMEEELGHVAEAIDRKVDIETVEASLLVYKRGVQDALRKRSKKSAVDREFISIRQHLELQLDETRKSVMLAVAAVQQSQERLGRDCKATAEASNTTIRAELTQLRLEVHDALQTTARGLEDCCAKRISDWQPTLEDQHRHLEQSLEQRLDEEATRLQDDVATLTRSQQQLHDEYRATTTRIATDGQATAEATSRLETAQAQLQRALDDAIVTWSKFDPRQLEQRLTEQQREETERLRRDLVDTLEDAATKFKDTEVESQLQTLDDKLASVDRVLHFSEGQLQTLDDKFANVDRVLNLIGKQLVCSASQLQVLWDERQTQLAAAAELLLEDEIPVSGTEMGEDSALEPSAGPGDNSEIDQLRSEHNALQAQVGETLRQYQALLRPDS